MCLLFLVVLLLMFLLIEWYADWVKLQIAYLIAADIVEDIDEELGFDFDASEYSEKVMRMTLKEVKKIMPSIKALALTATAFSYYWTNPASRKGWVSFCNKYM